MPDVSVIIPTYNRAELLKRAIQSVLHQTYQDFDIVVIDDASTDDIRGMVESFNDDRIHYIRHGSNRGPSASRNTGIRATKAKYIAFIDSDDEWLPEKLEKQLAIFETASERVGVVYTAFWRIAEQGQTYFPWLNMSQRGGDIHDALMNENFITTSVVVIRRDCFEKTGMFDEGFPMWEDWELWIRVSKHYQFRFIDEALAKQYVTPNSINTQRALTKSRAFTLMLEKHFEDIKKDRRLLAKYYLGIGHFMCLSGETREGRYYLVKAYTTYPFNIAYLGAALISVFGQRIYGMVWEYFRGQL